MRRPRLYTTSVKRKAAWRRRHGIAVRPALSLGGCQANALRADYASCSTYSIV